MKLKKIYCVLGFNKSHWLKQYAEFNTHTHTHTQIEAGKKGDKNEKTLYKLMNNAVYGITMGNFRSRIDVKLVSNKKYYLN